MTDKERLVNLLTDISRENGSVAVQTIMHIMNNILVVSSPKFTFHDAHECLLDIARMARNLQRKPDNWTHQGRFSRAIFEHEYNGTLTTSLYVIMNDLASVIEMLDGTYQNQFSVEHAQRFLGQVAKYSVMLQRDLNKLED